MSMISKDYLLDFPHFHCFCVQVQKSAVRVFGDWSEHVSSSGKGYFYNCRTEVSQWERPKEWVEA